MREGRRVRAPNARVLQGLLACGSRGFARLGSARLGSAATNTVIECECECECECARIQSDGAVMSVRVVVTCEGD